MVTHSDIYDNVPVDSLTRILRNIELARGGTNVYLKQSDPVPGATWVVGRQAEFCYGIIDTVPLILHYDGDQRHI